MELSCLECEDNGDLVIDRQSGDVICRNCGLVADSHIMDTDDFYFNDNCFITNETTESSTQFNSITLNSLNEINKICSQVNLPEAIKKEACYIFNNIKTVKRKNNNSMYATVIFIACQKVGFPRSKNEIINCITGVSLKDFSKFFKKCVLEVGIGGSNSQTNSSEFMVRFCFKLGLNNSEIKLCQDIADKCAVENFSISHTPVSLAASIIYFITFLPNISKRPKLSAIVEVTNVANVTIRTIYKCLKDIQDKLLS